MLSKLIALLKLPIKIVLLPFRILSAVVSLIFYFGVFALIGLLLFLFVL